MSILTEKKVKNLLKNTDLKESKTLLLEQGTIITPSAKGYLNGIKIQYKSNKEGLETSLKYESHINESINNKNLNHVNDYNANKYTCYWRSYCRCLTSEIISSQFKFTQNNQNELTLKLDILLTILDDFHQMNFNKSPGAFAKENSDYTYKKDNLNMYIDPETFTPKFSDGEDIITLYRLYTHISRLEADGSLCLQNYLMTDDYHCMLANIQWMASYVWELMLKTITDKR